MNVKLLLREVGFALSASLVALLLLWYLHDDLLPFWALGCGLVAGVLLRHALAPNYSSFPNFLRRPLELAVVLIGTIFAVGATLASPRYSTVSYFLSVGNEALTLTAAGVLLGLVVAALVYTHARMRNEVEESRIRESILRESALRAQLKALQAQINPHFLFNALNALAELTHEEPDRAEELIEDLSFLLRYSLRSSAVETVPSFNPGTPTKLFEKPWPFEGGLASLPYDISNDDQRFLMLKPAESTRADASGPGLVVVENWIEELRRLVPKN